MYAGKMPATGKENPAQWLYNQIYKKSLQHIELKSSSWGTREEEEAAYKSDSYLLSFLVVARTGHVGYIAGHGLDLAHEFITHFGIVLQSVFI